MQLDRFDVYFVFFSVSPRWTFTIFLRFLSTRNNYFANASNQSLTFTFISYTIQERRQKYEKGALRHHERHERAIREHEDAMRAQPNEPRRDLGANEEYDLALSHRDRKRLEKQQKYTREQRMAVAPEDDAEGRREIGGKIMSNRGLTPHRSKDMKNPRVRLKNKFAKAVVRRKGKVRDMKVGATTYGGEETGVKTSVIKSRKL